jgi:hypothetical protein
VKEKDVQTVVAGFSLRRLIAGFVDRQACLVVEFARIPAGIGILANSATGCG